MKFAMTNHRVAQLLSDSTTRDYIIVGFFFHDRGIMAQKSTSGMLQGLLYSVLVQSPKLIQFVHPIYAGLVSSQRNKLPVWDFEALHSAFEAILRQRQVVTRLCLFLDALDEHHGDNDQLAGLVHNMACYADGDTVKIKLCVASRPWDTFVASFSECSGFKIHEYTYYDIRNYTISALHRYSPVDADAPSTNDARSKMLETLAVQISDKAHGVFIWVRIVVDEIAKGVRDRIPFFVLEKKLANMPEELKDLYEHTLERIEPDHAEESYVMLQIARCALNPLSLETFVNTTSNALWGSVSAAGEETVDDMTQRVVSRSGGLLEIFTAKANSHFGTTPEEAPPSQPKSFGAQKSSGTNEDITLHIVQFIHQTVKEFVHERKDNLGLRRNNTGGNGFVYLFTTGAVYMEAWADEVANEIFEYAALANLDDSPGVRDQLDKSFGTLKKSRMDWWVERACVPFWCQFSEKLAPFDAKRDDFLRISFALAAGLSLFVKKTATVFTFDAYTRDRLSQYLFNVALLAPAVVRHPPPQWKMLETLSELGFDPDRVISSSFLNLELDSITPLCLAVFTKKTRI